MTVVDIRPTASSALIILIGRALKDRGSGSALIDRMLRGRVSVALQGAPGG